LPVGSELNQFRPDPACNLSQNLYDIQGDTKKRELLKNPTKIEEIQEKNVFTEIEPLQLAF